jgi:4-hydroxymandelate oxidase
MNSLLQDKLNVAMALSGCATLADIDSNLVSQLQKNFYIKPNSLLPK